MLLRQLLRTVKIEHNISVTHSKYSFSAEGDDVADVQSQLIQQKQQLEQIQEEQKKTQRPSEGLFQTLYDQINPAQDQPLVNNYLILSPRFKMRQKMRAKIQSKQNDEQKFKYFQKLAQRHKQLKNRPLKRFQRKLNFSLQNLCNTSFYTLKQQFDDHRFGNKIEKEAAGYRLAKLGAFEFINPQLVHEYIQKNKTDKVKQFYATGFFQNMIMVPDGYKVIINKIIENTSENGFYLNVLYQSFKQQVEYSQMGISLYNKMPVSQMDMKILCEKINNNQIRSANPLKFYWSYMNTYPSIFQQNYLRNTLHLMRKIRVNGNSAQNYISSLTNLFIDQNVGIEFINCTFKSQVSLQNIVAEWSFILIILSRIQTILSSKEEFKSVNFNDIFNLMRQKQESNYFLIKHQIPKILYEKCSPQVFMVYQKALKNYNGKDHKKTVDYFDTSKIQKMWGIAGKTYMGYNVQFYYPEDPLSIECNVQSIDEDRDYHRMDNSSEAISQKIHEINITGKQSEQFTQLTQLMLLNGEELSKNQLKEIYKQFNIEKNLVQNLENLNQRKRALQKNQKQSAQIPFNTFQPNLVREIVKGKFTKALDYVRLLIAGDIDQDPKKLQKYLVNAYIKSRKQGHRKGSEEEALFVLKQIQKKWIYLQKPDIKLNDQILFNAFQLQNNQIQAFDDQIQRLQHQNIDIDQELDKYLIQQFVVEGKEAANQEDEQDLDEQQGIVNDQDESQTKKETQDEKIAKEKKKKKQKKIANRPQTQDEYQRFEDGTVKTLDDLQDEKNARREKKKNWKQKKKIFDNKRPAGLFSKKGKNFSTIKQNGNENKEQSYENYLRQSKQIEDQTNILSFQFSRTKNFTEISSQFSRILDKINQKNIKLVLQQYQDIPVVGDISILIKYHFLRGKSQNTQKPTGLRVNFETSLGSIDKNYGEYLINSTFMFKFPQQLYNSLLEDQKKNFSRKQFKKIIAHFALHQTNISTKTAKLICDICNIQKIGVTLLQILQLFTIRQIKASEEGVKALAAGVQRYRNLETDLVSFLKRYCSLFDYEIESKMFEPYIESIVQNQDYQKLNNILQMIRHQLRPRQYKLNSQLSANQNIEAEKVYKIKQQLRFRNQNFIMLQIVTQNLKERTQVPLFLIELLDQYYSKSTEPLNSQELGVGLILYAQKPEKINDFIKKIRKSGSSNDVHVFECGLRVMRLFGRQLTSIMENIFESTLYLNKINLKPHHLHTIGEIFRQIQKPNEFNEYLEYLLRYQPQIPYETKRLYYFIFNKTVSEQSKNQMNSLLDMLFNQNKQKQRIQFKRVKEEEQKKAEMIKNLSKKQIKIQKQVQMQKDQTNKNNLDVDNIKMNLSDEMKVEGTQKIKKKKKEAKKSSTTSTQTDPIQSGALADNKFVYHSQLTKKQLRNRPLRNFLQFFMKRHEKVQQQDPKQTQKGKTKAKAKK